jgi:hypothetical protein
MGLWIVALALDELTCHLAKVALFPRATLPPTRVSRAEIFHSVPSIRTHAPRHAPFRARRYSKGDSMIRTRHNHLHQLPENPRSANLNLEVLN